jgi:hypothetical protein
MHKTFIHSLVKLFRKILTSVHGTLQKKLDKVKGS